MSRKSPCTSSRSAAITCLSQWAGSGRPVQGVVEKYIHQSSLKSEDRQLAVMLVMGSIRHQQYLDILLSRFSRTPLRKMKPLTLAALRVGVYQLCFLDRIPDSAAVNETIKALKKSRQPGWLLKFVNGTLRAISRQKQELPLPAHAGERGAAVLEHPDWLISRWQKRYGLEQMEAICRMNSLEPQLCLQANSMKTSREELVCQFSDAGIAVHKGAYCPDSLLLPEFRGAVSGVPGFKEGIFMVQDQAARLSCFLLSPLKKKGRYLDCCAGLGGKTCALASKLPVEATVTAIEPDPRRYSLLEQNLQWQGVEAKVLSHNQNLQSFARTSKQRFDGIFVDAPCSGTGVIRKHPDIRWNRTVDDLPAYQKLQKELLQIAATMLASEGVLVYATCSLEVEENEQVVDWFLEKHPEFTLTDCRDVLPSEAGDLVDNRGMFNCRPSEEIEGFFAARMVRKT